MPHIMFRSEIRHRVTPLFDVDLTLSTESRITALYGPSGAGKTTALKLVSGWIPSATAVYVEGTRIDRDESSATVPLNQRKVGMVFQNDLLFPHLDAAGNATFARRYLSKERVYGDPEFAELVGRFGAAHLMGKPVKALSGGERQRIGLIRALASRPKLLLCDEPVGAIDRAGRFSLLDRLREHAEAEGIVMLLITHDPDEIRHMAGHVWHIDSGRLIAEGPPERFFGAFGPNG
ncbi:ATP-binding cassette domain-containing protein [bacterium]|nr:ATP-binding cassette domain-containing protein [bacterium]